MSNAETELIHHHKNMTFRVDVKYLLRIHSSVDSFNAGIHYVGMDRNEIYKSESDFFIHLKKCGMSVQMPTANLDGEFLTILSAGTTADMFMWIERHSVDRNNIYSTVCYYIGKKGCGYSPIIPQFSAELFS